MTPYDMSERPNRPLALLLPAMWAGAWAMTRRAHLRLERIGMEGLEPPYLVLSWHQGFMDYYISPLSVFPRRASYVSDVEGFANYGVPLYRALGCLPKRRFVSDPRVVRNILHAARVNQDIVFVYPEARHSNVGIQSALPASTASLVKLLSIPVVVQKLYGSYLARPFWDEGRSRRVPVRAVLQKVLDAGEASALSAPRIQEILRAHFTYDEYRWQRENAIRIAEPFRAEGLHRALYLCPHCGAEYAMHSRGAELWCGRCGKRWRMDEHGQLSALAGATEFPHIPDWYGHQRREVERRLDAYALDIPVRVEALPNEKGFVNLGEGRLRQDAEGFHLALAEGQLLFFSAEGMESVQTEYDYLGKGQCLVLSTRDCCFYVYPACEAFNVTKVQLAAEAFHARILGGTSFE